MFRAATPLQASFALLLGGTGVFALSESASNRLLGDYADAEADAKSLEDYLDTIVIKKALYGTIVSATESATGERVVLKKLIKSSVDRKEIDCAASQPSLEDARLESEVLTRLNQSGGHPNVVKMHNNFETDTYFVMVMDQLKGELFDVVMEGRLAEPRAQRYFRDVIGGLSFIHSQGIAHRDLSLENLLLSADDKIVITDFGLCCDVNVEKRQTQKVGKGFYIAPEVFAVNDTKGGSYDPLKADVWSLGVVLFILLTGAPPMETPCDKDRYYCMLRDGRLKDLVTQHGLSKQISEDCIDLLSQMLCTDPTQRPSLQQIAQHRWVGQYNASPGMDGQTLDLVPIPELDINTVKRRLIPKVGIDTVRNHFEMCCE
jgi:serine/threonine protein kinase